MIAAERRAREEAVRRHARTRPDSERDPVCGMAIDPASATHRSEYAGHTYYFCSNRCRKRFKAEPARYLTPATPVPARGEVLWTCPMHPQVQRAGPGSCPICGMALEPMTPAGGDTANPELRGMTRRVCVFG